MVAIRKQNKNLTNLTKMLRNSPQFTTIIQYTKHHHHTQQFTIKIVTRTIIISKFTSTLFNDSAG